MIEAFLQATRNVRQRREPRVILDVGSCDGLQAGELQDAFPAARVTAFEADARNLPRIRANVAGHGRPPIGVVHAACCDINGRGTFYAMHADHPNRGAGSLYRASGHHDFERLEQVSVEVPFLRLDTWAAAAGVDRVDLLWMDIQGAELPALRGLGKLLHQVTAIHLEVSYKECYAGQALFPEVRQFLEVAGFACVHNWPGVHCHFGDAIFLNGAL